MTRQPLRVAFDVTRDPDPLPEHLSANDPRYLIATCRLFDHAKREEIVRLLAPVVPLARKQVFRSADTAVNCELADASDRAAHALDLEVARLLHRARALLDGVAWLADQ